MLHAFFCDDAGVNDGKFFIQGIFSELLAEGFPARHERLMLCAIINWERDVSGRREFVVDLLDPDDHAVYTVEGHTDVHTTETGRPPAVTHLVMPLENVIFPVAGCYQARFRVDEQEIAGPQLFLAAHAS